jgi:hypothetical protein
VCRPSDSLNHAARLLWENDIGTLPVVADDGSNRLVGIVTDRDICMAAYAGRKDSRSARRLVPGGSSPRLAGSAASPHARRGVPNRRWASVLLRLTIPREETPRRALHGDVAPQVETRERKRRTASRRDLPSR